MDGRRSGSTIPRTKSRLEKNATDGNLNEAALDEPDTDVLPAEPYAGDIEFEE